MLAEFSEDRTKQAVHVVTPSGNGIGIWNTKLWEVDEPSKIIWCFRWTYNYITVCIWFDFEINQSMRHGSVPSMGAWPHHGTRMGPGVRGTHRMYKPDICIICIMFTCVLKYDVSATRPAESGFRWCWVDSDPRMPQVWTVTGFAARAPFKERLHQTDIKCMFFTSTLQ